MKKRLHRLLSATISTVLVGMLMLPALAAEDASGALRIIAGSNGTLVASDEELAQITLENTSEHEVTIHVVYLGEETEVAIPAESSYTVAAPDLYDGEGNAYKLALLANEDGAAVEYAPEAGTVLSDQTEYTISVVKGVYDVYESHGQETPRWITCMVYADENGIDPERSALYGVADAVTAGAAELSNLTLKSMNDLTAAIRVGGTGSLTVQNADVALYGDGGDDFTGIGSALGVADQATLTVSDTVVYTEGVIRSAIFAGDEGTMTLNGVTVDCEPGEYQQEVDIPSAGMASPPNGLGIWGNCRAMNMVDAATVNIDNSEITAQNWGALGVDDVTDGTLNVKNSTIRIKEQGYGAYAIGKCVDTFENCVFEVAYGVVAYAAAGDGAEIILKDGTHAASLGYYGMVTHQSFNGLNTKIVVTGEDTILDAKLGGIVAKGRGADIEISDGAVVTAESGVLVRAQINDDTGAGSMDGTEVVNVMIRDTELTGSIIQGMGAEYEQTEEESDDMGQMPDMGEMPDMDEMPPEGEMGPAGEMGPEGGMGPGGPGGESARTESVMNVTVERATLEGAISSATLVPVISDGNISFDNIQDVGVISDTRLEWNSYATLNVALTDNSLWVVTEPCFMMTLAVDETSRVEAAPGYILSMTVDGEETEIEPGFYEGMIEIDVMADENHLPQDDAQEPAVTETVPEETKAAAEEAPAAEEPAATEAEAAPAEAEAPSGGLGMAGMIAIAAGVIVVIGSVVAVLVKKKK